jgi:hypothetical protein
MNPYIALIQQASVKIFPLRFDVILSIGKMRRQIRTGQFDRQ